MGYKIKNKENNFLKFFNPVDNGENGDKNKKKEASLLRNLSGINSIIVELS